MLKNHLFALSFVWLIALVLFPLPLVLLLDFSMARSAADQLLFIDCGLVAYCWWIFDVYLPTRPLWLDRLIGLPSLYMIHGLLGVAAVAAAYLHRHYILSMGRMIKFTGDAAWYIAFFILLYSIFFMSGWLVDHMPFFSRLKYRLQFFFKHQLSVWLHRLNLAAIFLIWLHVHIIGRINTHLSFMVLFDIYSFAIVGLYLWQKLVENDKVLPTKVLKLISVSPSAWQLTLGMTGNGSRNFKAGDFFFISFPKVKGLSKEAHPFSLTNAPIDSDRQLVFTIRKLGDFTKKLSLLKVGDTALVEGPFGLFSSIIDNKKEADLIFIGMGTGIAPLLSLSRQYQNQRRIKVVWTVKNLN